MVQIARPAPPPVSAPPRRTYLKWAAAGILLLLLGWVGFIAAQYLRTGEPISRLPGVPAPLRSVLEEPPRYVDSLYGAAKPLGAAVAEDGTLFVTEGGGDRMIRVYDKVGNATGAFAAPESVAAGRVPVYVAVSPSGEVYVSDREAQAIQVYSRGGELLRTVGSPFAGEGWMPLGLSFDTAGNLYVTDVTPDQHRVLVLDPEGKLLLQFGKQGSDPGDFWFPNAVAVDDRGRMYVADSNNGRVQVFEKDGKFVTLMGRGSAKADLALPRGIAVDNRLHLLFTVDTTRSEVLVYDVSGALPVFLEAFGDSGDDTGFMFPNGIALDGKGRAYVTDREHDRIQVWSY